MTASKMEILRGEILLSSVDDILNMLNMLAAAREDEQQKQKEAVIWLYKWTLDGKHYVLTHSDGTLCIASLDNDVERLKALAKARAEGAEQERERILNPLVDKHWNSKVDELREGIVGDLTQLAFLGGKHPEMAWGELRHKYGNPVVDSFIAACLVQGRAEGAEKEKQKQKVEEEIQHIRAEIKMYGQFLVEISTLDGLLATRMDYESKKKDAEERLASVLAPEVKP